MLWLDNMKTKLFLLFPAPFLLLTEVQSAITDLCFARNNITEPASVLHTSLCCLDTEWLVREEGGQLRCEENQCREGGVLYGEQCRDVYEAGLCGKEALGQRLYLGEDGRGYCDCEEGWVRYKERCYQEFTPAFCLGDNEILKLSTKPRVSGRIIFGEVADILEAGLKAHFSCIENPCEPSYFPHT